MIERRGLVPLYFLKCLLPPRNKIEKIEKKMKINEQYESVGLGKIKQVQTRTFCSSCIQQPGGRCVKNKQNK